MGQCIQLKGLSNYCFSRIEIPDSKVHGTNMGPIWVLSAPDGPHVGPMDVTIWDVDVFYYGLCRFHTKIVFSDIGNPIMNLLYW